MKQFIIFSIEPLPTRYSFQWFTHLPKVFKEKLGDEFEVIQLDGETKSGKVTKGAFLDFEATNIWKSEQTIKFFQLMKLDRIQDNAIILFTDAWNPCIHQLKYTKELCKKDWTLIGIWHAGSYDQNDFLGRIKDLNWSNKTERSFYEAYDINWFATNFHANLFHMNVNVTDHKTVISGFPMEYINDIKFPDIKKEDLIVFPGRMAPEKQPEIVKKLAEMLPEYKFVFCCEENMNKQQYHETLARAKVMISVSLQETLGITQVEGMAANCISIVPGRLSYNEMYLDYDFVYPSSWSLNNPNYIELADLIKKAVEDYDSYLSLIKTNYEYQMSNFFSCDKIIKIIKN